MTTMAFGWGVPTSPLGFVVRNASRSLSVSPSLAFRTDVLGVQMSAMHTSYRLSSSAEMSPPSALLNSLNELNGNTQR